MAPANLRLNPVGLLLAAVVAVCVFFYLFGIPGFSRTERLSMRELLSVSIELAERGGKRVREIAEAHTLQAKEKGRTKEGAAEMLTQGDLESHRVIVNGFFKTYPGLTVRNRLLLVGVCLSVCASVYTCVHVSECMCLS